MKEFDMNKTDPKKQDAYEPPEVRDIAPVSVVVRGEGSRQDVEDPTPGDDDW